MLESLLWSLASIDEEVSSDSIWLTKNRRITYEAGNSVITYSNLNRQCLLKGLFNTYNNEKLKTMKVFFKDGFLLKISFIGETTSQTASFEYKNGHLYRERICYYKTGNEDSYYSEEYRYELAKYTVDDIVHGQ